MGGDGKWGMGPSIMVGRTGRTGRTGGPAAGENGELNPAAENH